MNISYPKRLYSRHKSISYVTPAPTIEVEDDKANVRIVRIRLIFLNIGDIDTLNEKYQADVYYEARWTETKNLDLLKLDASQKNRILRENLPEKLTDYDRKLNWTPDLFIENAIGKVGEQDTWFTIKRQTTEHVIPSSPPIVPVEICEHRRMKGLFWEKLELNHFPADVQDLTISVSTLHHNDVCVLLPDSELRSRINREAFFDQQEWKLYEHVAIESRETKEEYSFDDEENGQISKKHSLLAFTCRAARRPGYYYWNGFCLIFLITACGFCIFSISPDLPQSRLQITCTLLLTSVTFRWIVNRSLPTISYLTTLDMYAIISIIILVMLCVWHSIIATIIFLNPTTPSPLRIVPPTNTYVYVDRYVFIGTFSLYFILHVLLFIWLLFVPYKRRREMEYLDREYAKNKFIQIDSTRTRSGLTQNQTQDRKYRRASCIHGNISIIRTPTESIDSHPDTAITIPTTPTFRPIREETETISNTLQTPDDQGLDEVFYETTNKKSKSVSYSTDCKS